MECLYFITISSKIQDRKLCCTFVVPVCYNLIGDYNRAGSVSERREDKALDRTVRIPRRDMPGGARGRRKAARAGSEEGKEGYSMPVYQSREDARRRIHEIAEGLKNGGKHAREADGFKLMYLLGTTEMNVDEAVHALETNDRQAGAGEAADRGQGFLDSVLDEMADALRTHDLGDDARLEEDTAYWGRLTGAAAEKLDEARKRRMREQRLRQQQVHREILRASAISCLEIHDMVCGEFNPYRRLFGNFTGVQFGELVDSLGDLAGTITETVVDVADGGLKQVVGGGSDPEPEKETETDGPEVNKAETDGPKMDAAETGGPEMDTADPDVLGTDAPEQAAAEPKASSKDISEPEILDAPKPEAPYVPVHEDDFLHRNSEPEPVTEEELLRANADLLSEEEYRRLIGYDGLVKEEEEAVAAAHPEQAERARRRSRAAERGAQAAEAGRTAGDTAERTAQADGAKIVQFAERTAAAGQPSAPENIPGQLSAPETAPPVLSRPSDGTPPVLARPEDKKLTGPRVLGPGK